MGVTEIKEKIKKVPALHSFGKTLKKTVRLTSAIPAFLAERKIKRGAGLIKVGFMCQYIPAWNKVEPVYRMMKDDPRFEPYLICVPDRFKNCQLQDPGNMENEIYNYFIDHGYSDAINALIGENQFLDLRTMNLSYVFYLRPYNALMPACYGTSVVGSYSRVCLIIYGMTMTTGILETTLNLDFMRNVYCYFAETPFVRQQNIANTKLLHRLKLNRTVFLGMPVLEAIQKQCHAESPAWEFSQNDFRVIWTPRWTTALEDGGSNFFTYYQKLLEYAREHPDVDILLRPHPLTFSHFLETGEMTRQQQDQYKADCKALKNVSIDVLPEYDATFWGSSVLVSDISGIMPEYFSTGKPLIFCATNMVLTPAEHTVRLLEGCYVVNNEQELFSCLDQLKRGIDPLAEKRQEIIKELFGDLQDSASRRIVEYLDGDYQKKNR